MKIFRVMCLFFIFILIMVIKVYKLYFNIKMKLNYSIIICMLNVISWCFKLLLNIIILIKDVFCEWGLDDIRLYVFMDLFIVY